MQRFLWTVTVGIYLCTGLPSAFGADNCQPTQAASVKSKPIVVETMTVQKANVPQIVRALGSVSAINQAVVSSDTDGRVVNILYTNGQEVGKGLPIVKLDDRQAKSAYQQSVTNYQLAKVKYTNAKALENEAVSYQELLVLKADMDNKFSLMQSAQVVLNELTITAPITGVLGAFSIDTGDFVKAGSPLVTLTNVRQLRVQYQVPESYLPKLKVGQLVTIKSDIYPKDTFYGTVSYISPTIDQETRSQTLQATVTNHQRMLLPGVFVSVIQNLGVIKGAIVVPEQTVQADIQGYYVYRVVDGHAAKTYIQEEQRYQDKILISSGLKAGDVIVSVGQQKLQDGLVVSVDNNDSQTGVSKQ